MDTLYSELRWIATKAGLKTGGYVMNDYDKHWAGTDMRRTVLGKSRMSMGDWIVLILVVLAANVILLLMMV